MNLGINGFLNRIKEHYDRVVAGVVLLALVLSLAMLWGKLRELKRDEVKFNGWLKALAPSNPDAAQMDSAPFEAARRALETPFQIGVPQADGSDLAWMFVPEARFNCRECRHPVPMDAENCPFCNAKVVPVVDEPVDHDADGMLSEWERKYGLDPFDPTDAAKDADGDGWTNLEEFQYGTDPTDPDSRPPAVGKLQLDKISGKQFGLRFNSRVKTRSGFKFGLNYRLPSGEPRTEFARSGDTVEDFKLVRYEEKSEPAAPPSLGKVDVSELTLLTPRGDAIVLVKDRAVRYVELVAHLSLDLRGAVQQYNVRKGDALEVDGQTYSVIDVDGNGRRVLLRGEASEKVITIQQVSAGGEL